MPSRRTKACREEGDGVRGRNAILDRAKRNVRTSIGAARTRNEVGIRVEFGVERLWRGGERHATELTFGIDLEQSAGRN